MLDNFHALPYINTQDGLYILCDERRDIQTDRITWRPIGALPKGSKAEIEL